MKFAMVAMLVERLCLLTPVIPAMDSHYMELVEVKQSHLQTMLMRGYPKG